MKWYIFLPSLLTVQNPYLHASYMLKITSTSFTSKSLPYKLYILLDVFAIFYVVNLRKKNFFDVFLFIIVPFIDVVELKCTTFLSLLSNCTEFYH